jgi:hypothetical protein
MSSKAKIYYGVAGVYGPYLASETPSRGCAHRRLDDSDIAREIAALEAVELAPPLDREQLEDFTKVVEWGRWSWEGMGNGEHPMYLISTCRKSSAQISDDEAIELDMLIAKLPDRQHDVIGILYVERKPLMLAAVRLRMDRQTMRNLRLEALQTLYNGLVQNRKRVAVKTA